jgi:hypothetical protein
MKYGVIIVVAALCLAGLSQAAEERWRNSNGIYNWTTYFGDTWHPGTVFKPTSGQYPVFLKKGYFGFRAGNVGVQVKVWSTTGNTPGSLLATFPVTTKVWPTWTDVDLSTAGIVISSANFFLSTNNPEMGPLGSTFKSANRTYPGYHYWSSDDRSWSVWPTSDWAIECTVETNYPSVAPASVGRVKALYR